MKRLVLVGLLLSLQGCAALESRNTMAFCQALDTSTTLQAIHSGAREANPVMAHLVAHPVLFIAAKGLLVWWLWNWWDRLDQQGRVTVNTISCIPVVVNVRTIQIEDRVNPPRPAP